MTSFAEYTGRASDGRPVIAVEKTVVFDTETPVSMYLKLRQRSDHSILLESVEGGRTLGRYSFVGVDPVSVVAITHGKAAARTLRPEGSVFEDICRTEQNALGVLRALTEKVTVRSAKSLPRFSGGWVGYFGYDSIRYIEDIPLPAHAPDDLPEVMLALFTDVLAIDNVSHTVTIISNTLRHTIGTSPDDMRRAYDASVARIERLESEVRQPISQAASAMGHGASPGSQPDRSVYEGWVARARDYIAAGDIFQVVLSRQCTVSVPGDPFAIYRTLRRINPSPYMYYMTLGQMQVIGSSPEMLIRVEDGHIQTRPIAGTRPRGRDEIEDAAYGKELLQDPKERAEHLMLVDLARNDLGKICVPGSVTVGAYMQVEQFSHVMHLCTTVSGSLAPGWTAIDALYACFPAGTLTGAPKVRAMQIISELENDRRGLYGGAVGYIDFSGSIDTCIAIRTIVGKDGTYRIRAGAGIVHDSVPEREYQETVDKMAVMFDALKVSDPGEMSG